MSVIAKAINGRDMYKNEHCTRELHVEKFETNNDR